MRACACVRACVRVCVRGCVDSRRKPVNDCADLKANARVRFVFRQHYGNLMDQLACGISMSVSSAI